MRKFALKKMVEAASKTSVGESSSKSAEAVVFHNNKWQWVTSWQQRLRWSPTSRKEIIESEKQLLSLLRSPYVQEQVNIGSGPPGSNVRWFRSVSNEPRFINTVTFDQSAPPDAPTIVLVHGYGASQGFFFRNFDALAARFRVVAVDQLGWGASSRPDFTCKSTEETEAWFVDSFEEWRKSKKLDNFILLGHSLGGYVAARYALKHPEHVKHLILVGPAGFASESDRIVQFRSTWRGAILNFFWDSNMTPQKVVRSLGPFGPNLVRKYTGARFGLYTTGNGLDNQEAAYFSDYIFHTLAARASGELCLKYIFSLGAFARSPLFKRAGDWKVPTTFIYGVDDWMNYKDAQEARKFMNVPTEMIRVPNGGHFVFLDNAPGFHAALFHTCRDYLATKPGDEHLPANEGLEEVPLPPRKTESPSSS